MANITSKIEIGTRVVLRSFLGTKQAPLESLDGDASEYWSANNYWLLVGQNGLVTRNDPGDLSHVLVKFDVDVSSLGLHCHNEVDNSLWIQLDDLELRA